MNTLKVSLLIVLSCLSSVGNAQEASKKRILVGSPIRQKPSILKEFLASLSRQNVNSIDLDFMFIDDNDNIESKSLLAHFAQNCPGNCFIKECNENDGSVYVCNEETHCWNDLVIWKVARFKDRIIERAKRDEYDFLFLIDSDLVLHPNTIEHLVSLDKDIVSEVFWTSFNPGEKKMPQVWLSDVYTLYEVNPGENPSEEERDRRAGVFLEMLAKPGVYEVGGLGACTLINKKALDKVSFKRIRNITLWGEDRHFCVRAVAAGLLLFADTHYPAYHIYRESDLAGVAHFVNECDDLDLSSDASDVFSSIYHNKAWGTNSDGEGWSGSGSSMHATKEYRAFIQQFLKDNEIASVVDLGCGDWEFSRSIDWTGIMYCGIDVVPYVIERNKTKYENSSIRFECIDAISEELPEGDLLICKDVLQHLSNEDIAKILNQMSRYKYCLITNDVDAYTFSSDNPDIIRGGYRSLDVTQPPFNVVGKKILTFKSDYVVKQTLLIVNDKNVYKDS